MKILNILKRNVKFFTTRFLFFGFSAPSKKKLCKVDKISNPEENELLGQFYKFISKDTPYCIFLASIHSFLRNLNVTET